MDKIVGFAGGVTNVVGAVGGIIGAVKGIFDIFGGGDEDTVEHVTQYYVDPNLTRLSEEMDLEIQRLNGQLKEVSSASEKNFNEICRLQAALEGQERDKQEVMKEIERQYQEMKKTLETYATDYAAKETEFEALNEKLKKMQLTSLADLERLDAIRFNEILQVSADVPPAPLHGVNVGFFGRVSAGKSTLINSLADQKLCRTGPGATTVAMQWHRVGSITWWDVQGYDDTHSYLSTTYVSHLKAMTKTGVVVVSTAKEMWYTIKLLDYLNLPYFVVVNKIDLVDESERDVHRRQIQRELAEFGLKTLPLLFCISASKKTNDYTELAHHVNS